MQIDTSFVMFVCIYFMKFGFPNRQVCISIEYINTQIKNARMNLATFTREESMSIIRS